MTTKTTTRKELICNKYQSTIIKLKEILPVFEFPVIDVDIEFIDLMFLFNHYFITATQENYKQIIDDFVTQNQKYQSILIITEDQKASLYLVFKEFIFWFKSLT
jgi:hypothetical protein